MNEIIYKITKFFITSFLCTVIFALLFYITQFYMQSKTKFLYEIANNNLKKKYVYVMRNNYLDASLYGKTEKDGKKLVQYYNEVTEFYNNVELGLVNLKEDITIKGDSCYIEPIHIPVQLKYLAIPQDVFVEDYNLQDSIATVYIFCTDCWGHFKAYVPIINLHDSLPPDSLFYKDFKNDTASIQISPLYELYGKPSPFGFYVNFKF